MAFNDVLQAPEHTLFNLDQCNRFLACRDGIGAELINPFSGHMASMKSWFFTVLEQIRATGLPDRESIWLTWLEQEVLEHDQAQWMRKLWHETGGDGQKNLHDYCSNISAVLLQRSAMLARA